MFKGVKDGERKGTRDKFPKLLIESHTVPGRFLNNLSLTHLWKLYDIENRQILFQTLDLELDARG